nr:MAG TPA: hypothetical protein [Caudoviricetes sp.]
MLSHDNNLGMMNVLEKYRIAHGLTYDQLATQAGLSARSVSYAHCHGIRAISAESAVKYARACGIPLHELRPDLWTAGSCTPAENKQPPQPLEASDAQ